MPDPIEELENFASPGLTMTPMPASEVRRRGTRLRRRNTALATVAGVAAVAVIATPLAVLASNHNSKADVGPADPSPGTSWRQSVPAEFDLTLLPKGAQFQLTAEQAPSIDDLTLCGAPAFSTTSNDPAGPALDATGASWGQEGSEGMVARTLAVYPDDRAAQAALDALQSAVESCPNEPRTAAGGPFVYDTAVMTIPGADDSFAYSQQVQFDATLMSDLTAYEVVRVGNALYLGSSHTTAGGPQAQGTFTLLADQSAPVVAGMCNFSATQECSRRWVLPPDEPEAVTASGAVDGQVTTVPDTISDDFPLTDGLPTTASVDKPAFGQEGPSHTLDTAPYNVDNALRACGSGPTGLPKAVDTLSAGFRDVSAGQLRQLMTFDSTDEAQAYADAVFAVFTACPDDTDAAGVSKIYQTAEDPGHGDYAASSAMRIEVGGQSGPGSQLVSVVRVGEALLLTVATDESAILTSDVDAVDLISQGLQDSQTVVHAMCLFTEAGC